ncbi:TetR/AcrR family transcriptional regulator [Nocardioides sp. URHA0020]|uniref:TetR/AcrR family transcriptional regulator n=1 Tax=Nocardioides sp. URHA0020 TaxID=1380392 RepID=UPI0004913C79|nr:TetR/AcrR family transcriptional regulator [Nocardioides sp. URHA0020]
MSSQMSTVPRQNLNPRQAETVERLFGEAAVLLEEVGHEQLTIRMVAARAGVSPATAYTYFASKDHLFAELFWRLVNADEGPQLTGGTPTERLRQLVRHLAELVAAAPALAGAVNKSLLGSDPEVDRLRRDIGLLWVDRFREAIGPDADPELITTLTLVISGGMLQAGVGVFTYAELGDTLETAVDVIMTGRGPDGSR